jgi:hypothetical protein
VKTIRLLSQSVLALSLFLALTFAIAVLGQKSFMAESSLLPTVTL